MLGSTRQQITLSSPTLSFCLQKLHIYNPPMDLFRKMLVFCLTVSSSFNKYLGLFSFLCLVQQSFLQAFSYLQVLYLQPLPSTSTWVLFSCMIQVRVESSRPVCSSLLTQYLPTFPPIETDKTFQFRAAQLVSRYAQLFCRQIEALSLFLFFLQILTVDE